MQNTSQNKLTSCWGFENLINLIQTLNGIPMAPLSSKMVSGFFFYVGEKDHQIKPEKIT